MRAAEADASTPRSRYRGRAIEALDPVPTRAVREAPIHLRARLRAPKDIATDSYGDILTWRATGTEAEKRRAGRIDVFDWSGGFPNEDRGPVGPSNLAVDSDGNLYVDTLRRRP